MINKKKKKKKKLRLQLSVRSIPREERREWKGGLVNRLSLFPQFTGASITKTFFLYVTRQNRHKTVYGYDFCQAVYVGTVPDHRLALEFSKIVTDIGSFLRKLKLITSCERSTFVIIKRWGTARQRILLALLYSDVAPGMALDCNERSELLLHTAAYTIEGPCELGKAGDRTE